MKAINKNEEMLKHPTDHEADTEVETAFDVTIYGLAREKKPASIFSRQNLPKQLPAS